LLRRIAISFLKKWGFFGIDGSDYAKCQKNVFRHNVKAVCFSSITIAFLMTLLFFYPEMRGESNRLIFFIPAVIELAIFCVSFFLVKRDYINKIQANTLVALFVTTTAGFCIAVLINFGLAYAISFSLFFFIFEVVFIFRPIAVILINLIISAAFYVVCIFFSNKNAGEIFDGRLLVFLNILTASILGCLLNLFTSRSHVKNLIMNHSLIEERNFYREESVRDVLTGLNNRRSFDQSVNFYISVCTHVRQTVCVVMMDVDYFKLYNDYYGHLKGDFVLQSIGKVLKQLIEEEHVYSARVGGEEFIMLWTENRTIECERIVLKLRQLIIDLNIPHEKSKAAPVVTASFGVYIMRGGSQSSAGELYRMADTALYKAKEWGRNRIVLFDSQNGRFREVDIRNYKELKRE
jgi:diguanylate cyclase (GGDEF)-like protein